MGSKLETRFANGTFNGIYYSEYTTEEIIERFLFVKTHLGKKIPNEKTLKTNAIMLINLQKEFDKKFDRENGAINSRPQNIIYYIDGNYGMMTLFDDKKYSVSTKINYISNILAMLDYDKIKKIKPSHDFKDTDYYIDKYKYIIDELQEQKKNNAKNNIPSNDGKKAILELTLDDIKNVIDKLNKNCYNTEALIIEFLLQYPCRLEVADLVYTNITEFNKLKKNKQLGNINYIVVGSKKTYVSRGHYKTDTSYDRIDFLLSPPVKSKLLKFIKNNDTQIGDSVFDKFKTPQDLAKRLHYITAKVNNGVSISTNIICKIATTYAVKQEGGEDIIEKLDAVNDVLETIGGIRGTNKETLMNNYLKRS